MTFGQLRPLKMKPAKLTEYQYEITRRLAWGETQKEVALFFGVSRHTIDNTLRKIFQKTEVTKVNELSAWFFCTEYNISMDLSPLTRQRIAQACMVIILFFDVSAFNGQFLPVRRARRARTEICARRTETLTTAI